MICRGRNQIRMDAKIDPDFFVRCCLYKICFRLFVLQNFLICLLFCDSVYCLHVYMQVHRL